MEKSSSKSKAEVRAEAGGVTGDGVWVQGCGGRGDPTLPRHQGPFAGQLQLWLSQLALGLGSGSPCVFGGCSVPNSLICPSQEAIYSSVPGDEVAKAEQEAKKKRRAEDTYITMVRSCSSPAGAPTSLPPSPGPWHAGPHSLCQTPASRAPCPLQTHPGTPGEAHILSLAPCSARLTAGTTASTWSWPRGPSRWNGWQRGHGGTDRARSPPAGQRRHFPSLQSSRNSCAVGWQPLAQVCPTPASL